MDKQAFQEVRKRFKKLQCDDLQKYHMSLGETLTTDPKQFWSFVHSKNKTTSIPGTMQFDGETLTDPHEIVNVFADIFKEAYTAGGMTTSTWFVDTPTIRTRYLWRNS